MHARQLAHAIECLAPATAGLYKILNPEGYLSYGQPAQVTRVRHCRQIDRQKRPIIFVHGMEFHSLHEVLEDFIKDFEQSANIIDWQKDSEVEFLFIHWDSKLAPEVEGPMYPISRFLKNSRKLGRRSFEWHSFYQNLEERAKQTAQELAPLMQGLLNRKQLLAPLVISHSMGSLIWAEIVSRIKLKTAARIGSWCNLQPALKWDDFSSKGRYHRLVGLYRQQGHRLSVWHSYFDVVLGTLFLGCHKTWAMGQIGVPTNLGIVQQDVSFLSLDSHGKTSLLSPRSSFFQKVAPRMRVQLRSLLTHGEQ